MIPTLYRFENKKIPVATFLNYEFKLYGDLVNEKVEVNPNLIERMLMNIDIWDNGIINVFGILNVEKDSFEILDKNTLMQVETLVRFILLDDYELEGLGILTKLNGLKFSDLENRFKRRINETYINAYFVEEWDKDSIDKNALSKFFK